MSRKYLTAKVTNEKKMLTSNWIREILNLLSNKATSNQKFHICRKTHFREIGNMKLKVALNHCTRG